MIETSIEDDILFTGFEPFASFTRNPSWEVARAAAAAARAPYRAVSLRVPVTFDGARNVGETFVRHRVVVAVGLAAERETVTVEHFARNEGTGQLDNDGAVVAGQLVPDGDAEIEVRHAPDLLAALRRVCALSVVPSEDAGGYVCNALLYHGLRAVDPERTDVFFVHVPMLDAEAAIELGTALGEAVCGLLDARK